jgi:hypothetical protein
MHPSVGDWIFKLFFDGEEGTPASTRRGRKTSTTTLQLGFQVMRRAVPERIMWLFQIYVKRFLPEALIVFTAGKEGMRCCSAQAGC